MKLHSHVLLLLALAIVAKSLVVCPDGIESNCYPQVFQPSNKWQVVQEGQHIPAGLHVRLNLETGEQEARLLQPEGNEESSELAIIENNSDGETKIVLENIPRQNALRKSRVSDEELLDYGSSVLEVVNFKKGIDVKRLDMALDTLIELSHDIDFGVQLSEDPKAFSAMYRIAETQVADDHVAEKIYRIMGALLRNNPKAVAAFVQNHGRELIPGLYQTLAKGQVSELVQKRILGVLHALSLDVAYAERNFSGTDAKSNSGLTSLIEVFPKLGASAKDRLVLILEDLNMIGADSVASTNERYSDFLQKLLHLNQAVSEHQFQTAFRSLAELHETRDIPISQEFLHWLSKETEDRKAGRRKRDHVYSGSDADFDSYLATTRHLVFGNPHAARKAGGGW